VIDRAARDDAATGIVVIGDAIVDVLEEPDGRRTRHPGGAGLNTAVGLAILGHEVAQVAALGHDADGEWLEGYLSEHGVHLIRSDENASTGTATSRRVGGEPTYSFDDALLRRDLSVPAQALEQIRSAPAVVVTSFPFDDERQVTSVCHALAGASGLRAVDPNPRPALLRDPVAFRDGLQRALSHADLAKLSEEDIGLLYAGSETDAVAGIRRAGTATVLLTRGPRGATLVREDGRRIDVAIASLPGPVVDTLGAGDATLASFVGEAVRIGLDATDQEMQRALDHAMRVAGATARQPGGRLRLPT
jgi:fructokinase